MSTNVFFIETLAIVYVLRNGLKSMQIDQKIPSEMGVAPHYKPFDL